MNDWTIAYPSNSGKYFVRDNRQSDGRWVIVREYFIEYYTLRGKYCPLACAECKSC